MGDHERSGALISAGSACAVEGGGHGLSEVCAQDPAVGGIQQGICSGSGGEGSGASAVATHISVSSPLIRSSLSGSIDLDSRSHRYLPVDVTDEVTPTVSGTVTVVEDPAAPMERATILPVEQRTAPLKIAVLPSNRRPRVSSP